MPSFYTHLLTAEETLKRKKIAFGNDRDALSRYYLGALGSDPFFLYFPLRRKGYNLARLIHRKSVYGYFSRLKEYVISKGASRYASAYVWGYVTHYATDILFHPYVYAKEYAIKSELPHSRRKDNVHFLIERDVDVFLTREYRNCEPFEYPFEKTFSDKVLRETFDAVSYAVSECYNINMDYPEYKNSIERFVSRQKFFADEKGGKRSFFYAAEKILFIPHVLSYMFTRPTPNEKLTNYSRKDYGAGKDSVYDLFEKSVDLSAKLISEFNNSIKKGVPLPETLFSTDCNTGKKP